MGLFPFERDFLIGDGLYQCNTGRDFLPVLGSMKLFSRVNNKIDSMVQLPPSLECISPHDLDAEATESLKRDENR